MCGICGFTFGGLPPDAARRIVQKMSDVIRHRGPDAEGFHLSEGVALGHRRLSIIDLCTGAQPMYNEDRSLVTVFNGEIYNYAELKKKLEEAGHRFSTHSDTEVLLHGYEQWGTELPKYLTGMFAFAIWRGADKSLFLARDRMGEKPLYYSAQKDFIFGSELKALLQHPDVTPEIDPQSLSRYLAYEYVPAPRSIFKNIMKLPAGWRLFWQNGKISLLDSYWEPDVSRATDISEAEACAEILRLLRHSVESQLMSDVPLGVFLSGGIDSTSVTALMCEMRPAAQIDTFSIAFKEKSFDESEYARLAAQRFGTRHHEELLEGKDMLDIMRTVMEFIDEPMADSSIIPTYLLSRHTRRFVTVALGGDGGDELFAGYDTFPAHNLARWVNWLPRPCWKAVEKAAGLLPVSDRNLSFDFKVKQTLLGLGYPQALRNQLWLGAFSPDKQRLLLTPQLQTDLSVENIYADALAYAAKSSGGDYVSRMCYLYQKTYLQDDILTKVDRASMACSLETRAPFLDYHLVDFANSLPGKMKSTLMSTKKIFKSAVKNIVPDEIIYRKKKGFGIPISRWFKTDLKDELRAVFSEERLRREGLFNPAYVTRLLEEHFAEKRDNRKQIWTLLIFQKWREKYAPKG